MALKITVLCLCFVAVFSLAIDEDKPWDCPENEEYIKCDLEVCWKNCADLKNPPPCPSIAAGCYSPACVCKSGWMRNDEGVCIPYEKCCGDACRFNAPGVGN
ncbi:unnamed protein product [Leptosia nina]|uniref:TIL domain-containing protein n=1 Tax=Leptosia nina TaxID=320188 RepID=A0AAV1J5J4_9NEOP